MNARTSRTPLAIGIGVVAFLLVIAVGLIGYQLGLRHAQAVVAAAPRARLFYRGYGLGGFLTPALFNIGLLVLIVAGVAALIRGFFAPVSSGSPRERLEQWHREEHERAAQRLTAPSTETGSEPADDVTARQ